MREKLKSAVIVLGVGFLGLPLLAEDSVIEGPSEAATLVELYSSEGCSSCPPAEKWVSDLKNDPRLWKQIVPVVFHVDYWDGLGWPDRFARKAYTQRQSDYEARWGATSVYTPEFIVDAREWHRWFGGGTLPLARADAVGALKITVHRGDWSVKVSHRPIDAKTSSHFTVNVAWLGMSILSDVRGGENGGRKLEHDFVVLDLQSKSASVAANGDIIADFSAPALQANGDQPGAIAAWLSSDDGGIYQVAGGMLK